MASSSQTLSLEELLALSVEIAALARCGVPLEKGLIELGTDLPGKTARMAKQLGQDMQSGQTLVHALQERGEFPPLYCAVVESGVRTGQLPSALERLADELSSSRVVWNEVV